MDDAAPNPADIPAPGSYHWTPKLQRDFLEAFATNGSVKISAAQVGMSPSAVYQLKQRPAGAAFKLGCAAATLLARGRLVDELLDRAIWGHDELTTVMREEDRSLTKRRRIDSRLGLAMLARLDRMVETRANAGEEMLAQVIAGDWPGFLSLFDAAEAAHRDAGAPSSGEGGAEASGAASRPDAQPAADADTDAEAEALADAEAHAETDAGATTDAPAGTAAGPDGSPTQGGMAAALALWLAGRDNRANPLASLWRGTAIANEVAQISAAPKKVEKREPTPEEEAAALTVWRSYSTGDLLTNFPPPEGYVGIEEGEFGDEYYQRTLDPSEQEVWDDARIEAFAPLRSAGEAARRAFFALPDPANDPDDTTVAAPPAGAEPRRQSASG